MTAHPDLRDFEAARRRIAGHVRRTPMFDPRPPDAERDGAGLDGAGQDGGAGAHVLLKLECLQASGSFKARGAMNRVAGLTPAEAEAGLITASGGNHGLAVAWAARAAKAPACVYLPTSSPRAKADGLHALGAEVRIEGAVWDDANAAALAAARTEGMTYVHPFADPAVIAGQGTLGLEILEQAPAVDTVLVAIGGGGLIAGVGAALKAAKPGVRIVGIEPTGAPTLYESLKAGELVALPGIDTAAGTLAPRRSMPLNFEMIAASVDRMALVTDTEMRAAARLLWQDFGLAVELAGAAAVACLMADRYTPEPGETVVAILCGKGTDGMG